MRFRKILISLLAAVCIISSLTSSAFAYHEVEETPEETENSYTLNGMTWHELIDDFITSHNCASDRISMGYYNTVTGETHYYRGDAYMDSASLYKVPLCMYYAEKISDGEITYDTNILGYKYSVLEEGAIVYSSNDYATALWQGVDRGNYKSFRDAIAPYMGIVPEQGDEIYYRNMYFTAEQMICCLKTLYDNPDRFPNIIDYMLLAHQNQYFLAHAQEYDVAHKYGYVNDEIDGYLYINDSAICYTDEPIAIVMYTASLNDAVNILADYCTLMCDYSQASHEQRLEAEAIEAENARIAEEERLQAELEEKEREEQAALEAKEAELRALTESIFAQASSPDSEYSIASFRPVITKIAAAAAILIVVLIIISILRHLRPLWGIVGIIFAALTACVCMIGYKSGTVYTETLGDPAETVDSFFASLTSGDYSSAYSYLYDYDSFGFENYTPSDDDTSLLYNALQESCTYSLAGSCAEDKLNAVQYVQFTRLQIPALSGDLHTAVNDAVAAAVEALPHESIYDENKEYLPEFISDIYSSALSSVLENSERYCTTDVLEIDLVYEDDRWQIITNSDLLTALCGEETR